jgi:hypothetical protein
MKTVSSINIPSKQGQIFTVDAAIAVITFIVIIIASIGVWEYVVEKTYLNEVRNDLAAISRNAAAVLVETPGIPANWTSVSQSNFNSTVTSLGLTASSSINGQDSTLGSSAGFMNSNVLVLDSQKIEFLENFQLENYQRYKELLGILGPGYEFNLKISLWNGSAYDIKSQIGHPPDISSVNVLQSTRLALLDGNWTRVQLQVWNRCEGVLCS